MNNLRASVKAIFAVNASVLQFYYQLLYVLSVDVPHIL